MGRAGFLMFEPIRHRGSLFGRTVDGLTQAPIPGVAVTIIEGPPAWLARRAALQSARQTARTDRHVTDGNGQFKYLDLPPGTYRLQTPHNGTRYAAATANVTVAAATTIVDLVLAPTTLVGVVQACNAASPLAMVRVRVVDSGEVSYTAQDGHYTLSPLEAGNRTIELSAQRYVTATQVVTLQTGQTTTVPPITLTRS
ncbi:MAG TPA: carboxypeptidase regulatory-like domain-containing protein [Kofleriaceae bacterium]